MSRKQLDRIMLEVDYKSELEDDILDGLALGNYEDNYHSNYTDFRHDWNEYVDGWN